MFSVSQKYHFFKIGDGYVIAAYRLTYLAKIMFCNGTIFTLTSDVVRLLAARKGYNLSRKNSGLLDYTSY